jgi:hypothetical protein
MVASIDKFHAWAAQTCKIFRHPIYRTSVERWRRYESWLGELRQLPEPDATAAN